MEEKAQIQVMSFINENKESRPIRRQENFISPIMVKVAIMAFMITVAMLLIGQGNFLGYVIYGKEVLEFVMFVGYVVKRRNKR